MNGEKKKFKVFKRIYKVSVRVKDTEVSAWFKTVTKHEQHPHELSCRVTTSVHSCRSSS